MKNKAQGLIEYVVLIGIIAGALIAMQVYIKRGIQGRMKDNLAQLNIEAGYSPGAVNSSSLLVRNISETAVSYSEPADPDNPDPDNKNSISEGTAQIKQGFSRSEGILPFEQEPGG